MKWTFAAAGVLVMLALQGCGLFSDKETQYRVAARELAADMAATNSMDGRTWPTISPDSAAKGEAGAFARTFKAYLIHVIGDRRSYRTQMDALDLTRVSKPEALSASGGFARAQAAIKEGKAILLRFRTLNRQRLADVRRDMTAIAPDSPAIKSFQASFDRSTGGAGGPTEKVFDLEVRMLDEYGRALDDLEHPHGRWRASGSRFEFANDTDLSTFNDHMQAIQIAEMEERTLVAGAQSESGRRVDDMNRAVRP
jgi:hypothetical protein